MVNRRKTIFSSTKLANHLNFGLSPYEIVLNQKPQKPKIFKANSSKHAQRYCQPTKNFFYYNLPPHTHDEIQFHHPQFLKLASGTHTESSFNRDKKTTLFIKKSRKNCYKDRIFTHK